MEIKAWKCDICGSVIEEDDMGYEERESIDIKINTGTYSGINSYKYKDVCISCRDIIDETVGSVIDSLKR